MSGEVCSCWCIHTTHTIISHSLKIVKSPIGGVKFIHVFFVYYTKTELKIFNGKTDKGNLNLCGYVYIYILLLLIEISDAVCRFSLFEIVIVLTTLLLSRIVCTKRENKLKWTITESYNTCRSKMSLLSLKQKLTSPSIIGHCIIGELCTTWK